jgi:hypothetical protein
VLAVTDPEPGNAIVVEDKLTVTPAGAPETVNATADLNPWLPVTVVVKEPVPPGATVRTLGELIAVRVSGAGVEASVQ